MRIILIFFVLPFFVHAQYAPPAGQSGSTAVFMDSSIIKSWAQQCWVFRGLMDISHAENGLATAGIAANACGKSDNCIVSLGDGGYAIYKIEPPLMNGTGADFAVFENSFSNDFLELAYVEVSSDSIHFYRFNSVSLTPSATQTGGFGLTDATKISNLAGKYRGLYGTPFDLEELKGSAFLQVDSIRYIKIIDVVGSVISQFANYDSQGNIINDPWPTSFESSGFDLDALGMMSQLVNEINPLFFDDTLLAYPIPVIDYLNIHFNGIAKQIVLFDITGKRIVDFENNASARLNFIDVSSGIYFLKVITEHNIFTKKIVK